MAEPRTPGQHRDLVVGAAPSFQPVAGGLAILPTPNERFAAAVVSAGGVVAPLSSETRGIIWLSDKRAADLEGILDENPQVEWVQLPWAGVDAFAPLLASLADRDRLLWTSAKGAYSEPVAEHALALALALLRKLPAKAASTSWATAKTGTSLYGRRVVIVGAGGIALELLRLLAPFEVDTTIVRRSDAPLDGATRTVSSSELHAVLATADVVILAAASTGETAHLIGAAELAVMQPTAVLVNIARGALVDQDALVVALRSGSIAAAGLDVTDPEPLPDSHPLWAEPNCVITSHSADTPAMTAPLLAGRIAANVTALLAGGPFVGIVDPRAGY
ncbi:hydroxyacid dehydrogenase [Glaciihabitans arcticus]|uniref:Hydroxyacid dehydrogenase n=1 Tax=Glaciihabitans arcticus TaxID=2668039 RepID=A0A4Q9GPZ2_9MICO|nr:NAD(P)-dependent oxidoreductase [Glaciihabitans arcticus]TBN56932.1 hydroxyacid dehydrogenase [Glaciihabitans arcticus]